MDNAQRMLIHEWAVEMAHVICDNGICYDKTSETDPREVVRYLKVCLANVLEGVGPDECEDEY